MSRASNRPPKLEPRAVASADAPPPTVEALVERAKIAGAAGSGPGPTELRRNVERLVAGDPHAHGELTSMPGLSHVEAWSTITRVFGATAADPVIDAARTVAATRIAIARVREVARGGGRIAFATSNPASLLTLQLALARLARADGGDVVDLVDFGPIRADGRTPRWLRWMDGVAVVSDGRTLYDTRDGEAARDWVFAVPRPALVVADGPFAEVAYEARIEVVAFSGLDRPGLAIAAGRTGRGTVVPMRTDCPARAYQVLEQLVGAVGDHAADAPVDGL